MKRVDIIRRIGDKIKWEQQKLINFKIDEFRKENTACQVCVYQKLEYACEKVISELGEVLMMLKDRK